jgi:hypothetical protein
MGSMDDWFDKIGEAEDRGNDWTVRCRVAFGVSSVARSAGRWVTGKGRSFGEALANAHAEARSR